MLTKQEATAYRRTNGLIATLATAVLLLVVTLIVRPHLNPAPESILFDEAENWPSFLRGNDWLRWLELTVFSWLGIFGTMNFFRRPAKSLGLSALPLWIVSYGLLFGGVYSVSRGWYGGIEQAFVYAGITCLVAIGLAVVILVGVIIVLIFRELKARLWTDNLEETAFGQRVQPAIRYFRAEDVAEPTEDVLWDLKK